MIEQNEIPVFGFLGVGAIGRPIAECILATQPMLVCDADPSMREAFAGRSETLSSAAELADRADVIFACLPSLEAHRRALLDPAKGIVAGKRCRGLVQVGTTGPDLARELAAELGACGIAMVDAPVSGGVPRARTGTLTVIASGDEALYRETEAAIRAFASEVVWMGTEPGSAQTMKLINNLLSAANLAIGCEALVLGSKIGLDPNRMLEVLNTGTGQNSATLTKIPNHVVPRSFDYGGRLELVCKDLKELVTEARGQSVPTPLADLVESIYRRAVDLSSKDEDMTTVIRHMERAAGIEVRAGD